LSEAEGISRLGIALHRDDTIPAQHSSYRLLIDDLVAVFLQTNRVEEALDLLREARKEAEAEGDGHGVLRNLCEQADALEVAGRLEEALVVDEQIQELYGR